MAKDKSKPIKKDLHDLTPSQFAEWELLEVGLEMYKKYKGLNNKPEAKSEVPKEPKKKL